MTLPKRIQPCPIVEATVELRFDSNVPPEAVFGIVYSALKDNYSGVEQLPITQIPDFVRTKDPNLAFQPHYKIRNENFVLLLGPKTVALASVDEYAGWEGWLEELLSVFAKINELGFISKVSRFGLRYINKFDNNIIKNTNLRIQINEVDVESKETIVRTIVEQGGFNTILQIVDNAMVTVYNQAPGIGSLIDIDVSLELDEIPFFENMERMLNDAHTVEKNQFFTLLKADFLEGLNPEYDK